MSQATAQSRPRMDPRIGKRRAAVAREQGRRRLRLVLAGAGALALGVAALVVLHSPLLAVRHLTVVGADHTARARVLRVAGLDGAPPLVDVDPGADAARLDALPWVYRAQVSRLWPDRVVVQVTERVPLAAVTAARGLPPDASALVDASGRVLAIQRGAPPAGVVALRVPGRVGAPGSTLGPAAGPGLLVARAAARALPGRVHGVAVGAGGRVQIDLGGGVTAELGPAAQLDSKLAALASVLAGAAPTGPEVVDVSVPGEPTVAPGAAASG